MEYTAEDLISHKLLRGGVLVAKPKFDQEGADLLGLVAVTDGARFCRIQCKGRSLLASSSAVEVPTQYVTDAFVLFLFVETGDSALTNLFAFFGAEMRRTWAQVDHEGKPAMRLSIKKATFETDLSAYRFTDTRVADIQALIRGANVRGEFAVLASAGGLSYSSELNFRGRPRFGGG
jgi:hypothetical protein